MNKICTKCQQPKPLEDFSFCKNKKDGLHSHCKKCISLAMKKAYKKNPNKKKEINEKCWAKISHEINEIKKQMGCKFCPEKEPVCLDFHHLNPNKKDKEVSYWVSCRSIKKALLEISKCICVCSNCHRKIHANLIVLHP